LIDLDEATAANDGAHDVAQLAAGKYIRVESEGVNFFGTADESAIISAIRRVKQLIVLADVSYLFGSGASRLSNKDVENLRWARTVLRHALAHELRMLGR
jgi:hypothetical protein